MKKHKGMNYDDSQEAKDVLFSLLKDWFFSNRLFSKSAIENSLTAHKKSTELLGIIADECFKFQEVKNPVVIMEACLFERRKRVKATLYYMSEGETPDRILFISRGEDWYALIAYEREGKKVAVITREDWMNGEEIC